MCIKLKHRNWHRKKRTSMTENKLQEKLAFPLRAWSIWLLGAIFMFYKYALEVSPSVMTETLMRTFNICGAIK
jgi:hypothetical protein